MLNFSIKRVARCQIVSPLLILSLFLSASIQSCLSQEAEFSSKQLVVPERLIDSTSIIYMTFQNSPDIAAARYELEAAEYQFKDFERNLSQFTPLLFRSGVSRDDRYGNDEDHSYDVQAGMEKEFFNGASVFGGLGHTGDFGDNSEGNNQFAEVDLRFPLFSSNTTLRRITARSREENEMYNARLEYIDQVRDVIQTAHERYYWLLTKRSQRKIVERSIADYRELLSLPLVENRPAAKRQLKDEIQALQSRILDLKNDENIYRLALKFSIGLDVLPTEKIFETDLYSDKYYGKEYLSKTLDELLDEARRNDVEIRVLKNARENSYEKKRLAEQGKWDIFVDMNARYDFQGNGDFHDEEGYQAGAGLRIRKIDTKLLEISLKRAEAEIAMYNARIRSRNLETDRLIEQKWGKCN